MAGVFTLWKLANAAATDQVGFFFLRAGELWRVAYLTGISLLATPCHTPMCLPFLGEVKYKKLHVST